MPHRRKVVSSAIESMSIPQQRHFLSEIRSRFKATEQPLLTHELAKNLSVYQFCTQLIYGNHKKRVKWVIKLLFSSSEDTFCYFKFFYLFFTYFFLQILTQSPFNYCLLLQSDACVPTKSSSTLFVFRREHRRGLVDGSVWGTVFSVFIFVFIFVFILLFTFLTGGCNRLSTRWRKFWFSLSIDYFGNERLELQILLS